jgi:hypothetical protein
MMVVPEQMMVPVPEEVMVMVVPVPEQAQAMMVPAEQTKAMRLRGRRLDRDCGHCKHRRSRQDEKFVHRSSPFTGLPHLRLPWIMRHCGRRRCFGRNRPIRRGWCTAYGWSQVPACRLDRDRANGIGRREGVVVLRTERD